MFLLTRYVRNLLHVFSVHSILFISDRLQKWCEIFSGSLWSSAVLIMSYFYRNCHQIDTIELGFWQEKKISKQKKNVSKRSVGFDLKGKFSVDSKLDGFKEVFGWKLHFEKWEFSIALVKILSENSKSVATFVHFHKQSDWLIYFNYYIFGQYVLTGAIFKKWEVIAFDIILENRTQSDGMKKKCSSNDLKGNSISSTKQVCYCCANIFLFCFLLKACGKHTWFWSRRTYSI